MTTNQDLESLAAEIRTLPPADRCELAANLLRHDKADLALSVLRMTVADLGAASALRRMEPTNG